VKWRKARQSICDRNHALSAVGEISTQLRGDECYGSFGATGMKRGYRQNLLKQKHFAE
jgi:hypothetical protein